MEASAASNLSASASKWSPRSEEAGGLVPSQAMTSRNRPKKKKNNQRPNGGGPLPQQSRQQQQEASLPSSQEGTPTAGGSATALSAPNQPHPSGKKRNNARRNKNKKVAGNAPENGVSSSQAKQQQQQQQENEGEQQKDRKKKAQQQQQQKSNQKKQGGGRNRNNRNRKKYPWRGRIPQGTVDPITLDALVALEYPPFALANTPPYVPVPIWPVPENASQETGTTSTTTTTNLADKEELNRRRIEEQWGGTPFTMTTSLQQQQQEQKRAEATVEEDTSSQRGRHYHLYDGRALAYYLVSQLQFIDPLNRRDLTRDELLNLDSYLKRHGFADIRVTEAYDAKGITISSAGAAANTARGRSEILQQTAQVLLNSLFGGPSVAGGGGGSRPTPVPSSSRTESAAASSAMATTSALQDQYAELQRREQLQAHQRHQELQQQQQFNDADNGYFASEDGGLIIIDDDENPGMRGGGGDLSHMAGRGASGSLYSASHIANRYGAGVVGTAAASFPALSRPVDSAPPATPASDPKASQKKSAKPSKTLSRITGAVKKTNPEEAQKQWEAREEARKRALLANLRLGVDPAVAWNTANGPSAPPPGMSATGEQSLPSEEKLQRNRNLAEALGVAPATTRGPQQYNSGWARPTDGKTGDSLDEFGNELQAALYPDGLILQAQDRMNLVIKIERKWKNFLVDDAAASLPLNPMDRPSRTFVHQYSDFWNLKTESFDPEPNRYIHCVKMLDTHAPHPLLSEAARNWRGAQQQQSATVKLASLPTKPASDHTSWQVAGQKSREMPPPPDRVPLPLKPRSVQPGGDGGNAAATSVSAGLSTVAAGSVPLEEAQSGAASAGDPASRFGGLFTGRERPKLELAKRTIPLELPPHQSQQETTFTAAEAQELQQARQKERARKEREAEELKRQVLEDVFASDDETASHNSSEWGDVQEQQALYNSDDEE